jgi:hypothetical protein
VNRQGPTRRGQALAEFALIIPLFLILALALVDFGRGIFIYSAIANVAREGARYAIVHGTNAGTDSPANPISGPGIGGPTDDANGTAYVEPAARSFAFGLDQSVLKVRMCWGFGCTIPPDCVGPVTNQANRPDPNVPVTVRTCYDFQPITASFLKVGPMRLGAQATLTITH